MDEFAMVMGYVFIVGSAVTVASTLWALAITLLWKGVQQQRAWGDIRQALIEHDLRKKNEATHD